MRNTTAIEYGSRNWFHLTQAHVTLLRNAYVGWQECEYGAPEIDPKRPYGNSDGAYDVYRVLFGARLVDLESETDEDGRLTDRAENLCDRIHRQTETALQIVLRTGQFETGWYATPDTYSVEYEKVADGSVPRAVLNRHNAGGAGQ